VTGITQTPAVALADLYTAAADEIEARNYVTFNAGPAAWSAVHRAVHDLVTSPLVEGLRRRLRVEQVQWWEAEQAIVAAVLRELAEGPEQLDLLQDADAENRVAAAAATIRDALGYGGEVTTSLGELARCAADRIKLLEAENEKLRKEADRGRS
jgi:hypothetical protein